MLKKGQVLNNYHLMFDVLKLFNCEKSLKSYLFSLLNIIFQILSKKIYVIKYADGIRCVQ